MPQSQNKELIRILRDGTANFLAGIFLILTAFELKTNAANAELVKYLTWVLGGITIAAGFAIILTAFPLKNLKEQVQKLESNFFPFFYLINILQLFINAITFYLTFQSSPDFKSLILLFISSCFVLLILSALLLDFLKRFIKRVLPLLYAAMFFNVFSIIQILMKFDKWQVLPYVVISTFFLCLALYRYMKEISKDKQKKE